MWEVYRNLKLYCSIGVNVNLGSVCKHICIRRSGCFYSSWKHLNFFSAQLDLDFAPDPKRFFCFNRALNLDSTVEKCTADFNVAFCLLYTDCEYSLTNQDSDYHPNGNDMRDRTGIFWYFKIQPCTLFILVFSSTTATNKSHIHADFISGWLVTAFNSESQI